MYLRICLVIFLILNRLFSFLLVLHLFTVLFVFLLACMLACSLWLAKGGDPRWARSGDGDDTDRQLGQVHLSVRVGLEPVAHARGCAQRDGSCRGGCTSQGAR